MLTHLRSAAAALVLLLLLWLLLLVLVPACLSPLAACLCSFACMFMLVHTCPGVHSYLLGCAGSHLFVRSFVLIHACLCSFVCMFALVLPFVCTLGCAGFCPFMHSFVLVHAHPCTHSAVLVPACLCVCSCLFVLVHAHLGSFVCIKYTVSTHIIIRKLTFVICILNLDKIIWLVFDM